MEIKTLNYQAPWVGSTVTLQEDGSVREVGGWRCELVKGRTEVAEGAVFPSVRTWVETLNAEVMVRCPWIKNRAEKLKAVDIASSVVWVESAGHYMEVRRGEKTKFAAGERRTWATVDEWLACLTPPASPAKEETVAAAPTLVVTEAPVDEEEKRHIKRINELMARITSIKNGTRGRSAQADVAIELMEYFLTCKGFCDKYPIFRSVLTAKCNEFKSDGIEFPALGTACDKVLRMLGELEAAEKKEAVVLAAPAPVVKAFDAEKFKETWIHLRDLTKKETGKLRSAYLIQLCQFLLESRPAAEGWLAVNPVWRYTARAIVQELGWTIKYKQGGAAVAAFLEKF